ncbi:MAG: hypothetical protein CXT71_04415 [Methanobacteriota archaeon]|nr:MAG: hypothetical protein CXT71_04415 [Euryarchaeota archaeon]
MCSGRPYVTVWRWEKVSSGDEIARLKGDREAILVMERPILNILGQLSGIATEARKWSTKAPKQIACTRKTIWGLLDKWAVQLGGGLTHRLSKSDARMLKENDLASLYPELDTHGARIARFISEDDQTQNGAFLEIEVRTEKEATKKEWSMVAIKSPSCWTISAQNDAKVSVMNLL